MRKKIFIILTILWMAMIFYMSNQPAAASTVQSNNAIEFLGTLPIIGNVIETLTTNGTVTVIVRKSAHMFSYAMLSIFVFMSMYDLKVDFKKLCIKSIVIAFIYAITDEIHQFFIPGRSCELRDVLIDTSGAILAMFVVYLIVNNIEKKYIEKKDAV